MLAKNVHLKKSKILKPSIHKSVSAGTNIPKHMKAFFVLYDLCKVHMVLPGVRCTVATFFPTEDLERKTQQHIVYHRRMKATCMHALRNGV